MAVSTSFHFHFIKTVISQETHDFSHTKDFDKIL